MMDTTSKNLLLLVVIAGLFYVAGQYISTEASRPDRNRTISVEGVGEAEVRPDTAQIMVGLSTGPQADAETAVEELSTKFNHILDVVRKAGVEDDDVKTTNLSVNPVYDFTEGRQELRGYEASETVEIKVKDTTIVGQIVSAATAEGANQIGGISFVVGDENDVRIAAEQAAAQNAQAKAEQLAESLDASLGEVLTLSSFTETPPDPQPLFARGGLEADTAQAVPPTPSGVNTFTARVSVTYQLK